MHGVRCPSIVLAAVKQAKVPCSCSSCRVDRQRGAQALREQEREIQYAVVPADRYKSDAAIEPAAIEAYYKAHRADYMVPESVDLRYAQLTLAQVAGSQTITDADLQAA